MSTAEPSPGTASANSGSNVAEQMAPPPVVCGEPAEVADGVLVIPDGRVPLVPNVGFVIGDHAVLVIDTGVGRRNGAYVLEHARRLAGGRPVFLTTTHFHPEHSFGAQVFKGEATIIYNRQQRDELHRKGAAYIEMFKGLGPDIAAQIADIELTDPDVTYDGQAEIDLGGHRAVLHSWGPAHTAGDQTILVDGRVLFGGDLFETRMFPIVPYFPPADTDVDGSRWITVLDQLMALDPAVVVPGHGEVTDVSLIRDVRDYLDYVRSEAGRLRASGVPAADSAAAIEQGARVRWDNWANPEWIDYAARAFYQASLPPARVLP